MAKKIELEVHMNHGRWLHRCLKCGELLPVDEKGQVCPMCHPGVRAVCFTALPSPPYPPGTLRKVPDMFVSAEARAEALQRGEVYYPEYPKDRVSIEKVLRMRKKENMNWDPGETVGQLIADNIKHGDPVPVLASERGA